MILGQPDFSIIGRNECVCQEMAECIVRVTILFDGKSDRTESKIHKRGKCFIDLKFPATFIKPHRWRNG